MYIPTPLASQSLKKIWLKRNSKISLQNTSHTFSNCRQLIAGWKQFDKNIPKNSMLRTNAFVEKILRTICRKYSKEQLRTRLFPKISIYTQNYLKIAYSIKTLYVNFTNIYIKLMHLTKKVFKTFFQIPILTLTVWQNVLLRGSQSEGRRKSSVN